MKPKDRQKICSNCDGRIAVDSEECPYCATSASSLAAPAPLFDHQSIQDSLTSLYTPPYSNKNGMNMKNDKDKSKPKPINRESHDDQLSVALGKFNHSQAPSQVDSENLANEKSSFTPLLFLLLGGNLLIVGLLQFFFSEGGVLKLEWDSKYWFMYCLIALPCVWIGYKKANECKGN